MPDVDISRENIFNGVTTAALKRIRAIRSNDIMQCDQLSELIFDVQIIRDRLIDMIFNQVAAHNGIMGEVHDTDPIIFSFADPGDEADFIAWIGVYGTDTICPTRTEHESPVKVECWSIFDVEILGVPLPADVTILTNVITVIDVTPP